MRRWAAVLCGAVVLAAQGLARLDGTWQARAGDEIRRIMVRRDSSAQFGDQMPIRSPTSMPRRSSPRARRSTASLNPA